MKKQLPQAVALGYDPTKDKAPCVVAKGSGLIAEKIIEAARRHDIPIVADPIAGGMLAQADLGAEISPEFYQAVAEILAFVYRLNDRQKHS
jgi:flagellar biosynthesis protein